MRVKSDYCNACRRNSTFQYVSHDENSVIAHCQDCGERFDLINDGTILRQFRRPITVYIAYYLRKVNAYNGARFDILRGRPAKVPPANRSHRLLCYKLALNSRLESERGAAI